MQCVNMLAIVYCWNKSSRMLLRDFWVWNAVKGGTHEQLTTFFSVTKQTFAAFYFNRSRSRVDKRSLISIECKQRSGVALSLQHLFIYLFNRKEKSKISLPKLLKVPVVLIVYMFPSHTCVLFIYTCMFLKTTSF
jgi:hypothetical protein